MPKLTEAEITERLPAAKNWDRVGDMLVRSWQFSTARRALEFLNDVATIAERTGHHPDITLSYRTVRLEVSTHADGGLTPADFQLIGEVEAIPTDRSSPS